MSVQDLLGNEVTLKSSKASSHEIPDAPILPPFAEDAGSLARAKVQARGAKVKQVVVRTYVILTLLLLAAIGAGIYYLYLEYSKPGKRVVDYRPCEYVDEKQNIRITGRREYSYMQKSMFGHDFRQRDNVIETTQIDINGNALTIVGLDNGKWWAIPVGMGEKGIQLLKPAHTYVVTMDKKAAVINYTQFCQ